MIPVVNVSEMVSLHWWKEGENRYSFKCFSISCEPSFQSPKKYMNGQIPRKLAFSSLFYLNYIILSFRKLKCCFRRENMTCTTRATYLCHINWNISDMNFWLGLAGNRHFWPSISTVPCYCFRNFQCTIGTNLVSIKILQGGINLFLICVFDKTVKGAFFKVWSFYLVRLVKHLGILTAKTITLKLHFFKDRRVLS